MRYCNNLHSATRKRSCDASIGALLGSTPAFYPAKAGRKESTELDATLTRIPIMENPSVY